MKFRFNGGLDCPEWILSQIPEITKTNPKTLQALGALIIERTKTKQTEWPETDVRNFCDNEMSVEGLRALKAKIAALCFIFQRSAKNDCSSEDLGKELLQLGLPSEHASVLVGLYDTHHAALCNCLAGPAIKAPSLAIVKKLRLPKMASDGPPSVAAKSSNYFRLHTLSSATSDGNTRALQTNLIIHRDQMDQLKTGMEDAVRQLEALTNNCQ